MVLRPFPCKAPCPTSAQVARLPYAAWRQVQNKTTSGPLSWLPPSILSKASVRYDCCLAAAQGSAVVRRYAEDHWDLLEKGLSQQQRIRMQQQAYRGDDASTALWNMWQHQQLAQQHQQHQHQHQQQQQQGYKANGVADGEVGVLAASLLAAGQPCIL